MKKIFILLIAVYTLQGCLNAETKHRTATLSHQDKVYYYLKEELKAGYSHGDERQTMEMDRAYFSVVGEELRQYFKKSGFKFLDKEAFKHKVTKLFKLNEKSYIKESNRDYIDTISLPFSMDMLTFLPDKGLLTFPYKMPEIVDYVKKYPELVVFEERANEAYKKSGNIEQRVSWNVIHKDYTQYTRDNRDYILSLNKYLLNDDFTQRTWLVENSYTLMYDLYASGYKEDIGLLKALLKEGIRDKHKNLEWYGVSAESIEYLLVIPKKVEGHYMVREEAFVHLTELMAEEKEKLSKLPIRRSKDGKLILTYSSHYMSALKYFTKRFKKIEAYKPVVTYIEKFLKRIK